MSAHGPKKQAFVSELLGRGDYAIIGDIVEPGTKVLDLGCGGGELLQWLAENKGVEARGLEPGAPKMAGGRSLPDCLFITYGQAGRPATFGGEALLILWNGRRRGRTCRERPFSHHPYKHEEACQFHRRRSV